MPDYITGCVLAVPTKNKALYRKNAKLAAAIFKDHGALKITECWGVEVPDGKLTSFPKAVKCKKDETVVFSWIVWPSRAVHNRAKKSLMSDERMRKVAMPFDGKRLIYGCFQPMFEV